MPIPGLNFTSGKSTDAAKAALAAAIAIVDPTYAKESIMDEKNWRSNYYKHFVKASEIMLKSTKIAIASSKAGLQTLRNTFQINNVPLSDVEGRSPCTPELGVSFVKGKGKEVDFICPMNGKKYSISSLIHEMERLVQVGAAEPSALESVKTLANNPEWLSKKSLSSFTFAILGAGSQMGPCKTLLRLGATVLAIDLKGREEMWDKLSEYTKTTCGTLVVPMSTDNSNGGAPIRGCDILTDFESIGRWIVKQSGKEKRIVIGGFLYSDGGLFTRLATAADAVIDAVCRARSDTVLVSLCSPTEVFSVPHEANKEAKKRYDQLSIHTPWERSIEWLSGSRYLERNAPLQIIGDNGVDEFLLQDSQVWQQGPNYSFAKLIQRWRNIVARDNGHWVSSNVAPASLTVSVMHNSLIRAGMLGCQFFGIVPFEPETSNTLMTALAIHDIKEETSYANPTQNLRNPLELFHQNSVHGGTWRCAFATNSYTEVSAVIYGIKLAAPYVAVVGGVGCWLGMRKRRSRL
jgi:hypothetical protein